jgi:hypothetical protein
MKSLVIRPPITGCEPTLFCAAVLLIALGVRAQPLVYEPFDYSPGQLLTGRTNAAGPAWINGGAGVDDATIVADGLTIPVLATPLGNCLTNGGAGPGNRILFNTTLNSRVVLYSFALRVDSLGNAFAGGTSFITSLGYQPASMLIQAAQLFVRTNPAGTGGYVLGIITCGDGGVVTSNDDSIGPLLRRFGDKGTDRGDRGVQRERLATNYRMSELLAAFAAAQCARLEGIAEKRSKLGDFLSSELAGVKGVTPPRVDAGNRCTYWNYLLRLKLSELRCNRATFVKALGAEGLTCGAGYIPELLYEEPVFRNHSFFGGRWPVKEMGLTTMDYGKVKLPEAESIRDSVANMRVFESMDEEYVRQMARAIRKVARHYAA